MAQSDFNEKLHNKDFKRYMEWGVSQPVIQKKIINQLNKYYDHDKHEQLYKDKRIVQNIGQQLKHFKTQYSQVSAIETGFKKLKSNQIDILRELKKQYEVLRNSSLDNKIYYQKKNSQSQSYGQQKSASNSEALSSIKSKRSLTKISEKRQLQAANLQKKQLEMMLNNSMKKIQELLHNQIELKNTILALKSKQQQRKWNQSENEITLKRSREIEQNLRRNIKQLQRQIESLKLTVKQCMVKNGNLQGGLHVKEIQFKKHEQKVRLMEQQIKLQKSKYLSLELYIKKLQAEYDLLQRVKNQQLIHIKKNKNIQEDILISQKQNVIKRLQDELLLKEERYILLLNKFNSIHSQPQATTHIAQSANQQKNAQKMYQILQDRAKQHNDEAYRLIMQKLSQIENKTDDKLTNQINFLKSQLQILKNNNNSNEKVNSRQNKTQIYRAEQKIKQLQKIIDEENIQKMYFIQDVQKVTRNFANIKKEKEKIQKQLKNYMFLVQKLQYQNKNYKEEINRIKNTNIDLTQSQNQNQGLIKKIQYYNLKESQIHQAQEELNRKIQEYKLQQDQYEEEVRLLKRQLNDEELKTFKSKEEYELKIRMINSQNQSAIAKIQQQLQHSKKSFALQKADLINQRIQWQKKHFLLNEQYQKMLKQLNNSNKTRQILINKKIEQYQAILRLQRQNNGKQMNGLLSKIQSLSQINERLMKQAGKYMQIESQILQLKRIIRMNRKLTQNLDHLWSVKQVQYDNINEILKIIQQKH